MRVPRFGVGASPRQDHTVSETGAVRVARQRVRVANQDELARLATPFRRSLRTEFDLASASTKLCPVELEDGSVTIFTVEEYHDSDQTEELERLIRRRQRLLSEPSRIVVPPTLLLAIVREQISGDTLRNRRRVLLDPDRSSMAQAFQDMVEWGVRNGASDLHVNVRMLGAESDVRYTVGGRYVAPERFRRMPTATVMDVLSVAWMDIQGGNGAVFDPVTEQQGRLYREVDGQRLMLRWASLATDAGPSVCLRILHLDTSTDGTSIDALGYLPSQLAMMARARMAEGGAVVLAGVVGSGKSTTIASMLRTIPAHRKVITLEDPVEYLIPHALQNTVARPLDGSAAGAFDAKLKTVKRSAMTDLLIGEIRDAETGRAFTDLAGSGANLYTTTHAGGVLQIADRLSSDFIGVPRELLATPGVLKLLICQALLPRLCDHCALPFRSLFGGAPDLDGHPRDGGHWQAYGARIEQLYDIDIAPLRIRNPEGCPHCAEAAVPELLGLAGRTVVAEMIEPALDDVVLGCIRRADNVALRAHAALQRESAYGDADMTGKSAMECAVYKASIGLIDPRDIEPRFRAFETVALERRQQRRGADASSGSRIRPRFVAVGMASSDRHSHRASRARGTDSISLNGAAS